MKKLLVVGLAAGLIAGSLIGPAEAKKKKKPKPQPPAAVQVDLKFFMRQDAASCTEGPHEFLSLTDGTDLSCNYTGGGATYEAYHQANTASGGKVPVAPTGEVTWTTEDGTPFVLDGSKNITGEITVSAAERQGHRPAAGEAEVDILLVGEVGGELKELGTMTETYTVTPDGAAHLIKVDFKPDASLVGQTFTSLTLTTRLRGKAVGATQIELDAPASFISVPAIQ